MKNAFIILIQVAVVVTYVFCIAVTISTIAKSNNAIEDKTNSNKAFDHFSDRFSSAYKKAMEFYAKQNKDSAMYYYGQMAAFQEIDIYLNDKIKK